MSAAAALVVAGVTLTTAGVMTRDGMNMSGTIWGWKLVRQINWLPGAVRRSILVALVVVKYQKLSVYVRLLVAGGIHCLRAPLGLPGPEAIRCRLALPEWLKLVMINELVSLSL